MNGVIITEKLETAPLIVSETPILVETKIVWKVVGSKTKMYDLIALPPHENNASYAYQDVLIYKSLVLLVPEKGFYSGFYLHVSMAGKT